MDLAKIEVETAVPEHLDASNNALPSAVLGVARAGS